MSGLKLKLEEHDRVRLTIDQDGIKAGTEGAIVHVHRRVDAFEAEFFDGEGRTIGVITVMLPMVEPIDGWLIDVNALITLHPCTAQEVYEYCEVADNRILLVKYACLCRTRGLSHEKTIEDLKRMSSRA